jgi:hypothetical protein
MAEDLGIGLLTLPQKLGQKLDASRYRETPGDVDDELIFRRLEQDKADTVIAEFQLLD